MPVIMGNDDANTLFGANGPDSIYGLGGGDLIYGLGGDDFIDGGSNPSNRADTAGYTSLRRQYVASSTSVSGHSDGTDTLVGIEVARFTDGSLVFSPDGIVAKVARIFQTVLGREIDARTLDVYGDVTVNADPRATRDDLVTSLFRSVEYGQRFAGQTDAQFVVQMYRNALQRDPAAGEVTLWTTQLNRGASRAQIALEISDSTEARSVWAADAARGYWVGSATGEVLASLYDAVFNRLPDVDGFNTWVQRLNDNSFSLSRVISGFLGSQEYVGLYGGLSNAQFVAQTYRFAFGREGDVAGAAEWVNRLDTGSWSRADMLVQFVLNVEAVEHSRPIWEGGVRYLGLSPIASPALWDDGEKVIPADSHGAAPTLYFDPYAEIAIAAVSDADWLIA